MLVAHRHLDAALRSMSSFRSVMVEPEVCKHRLDMLRAARARIATLWGGIFLKTSVASR
jgi:hypothetical protein